MREHIQFDVSNKIFIAVTPIIIMVVTIAGLMRFYLIAVVRSHFTDSIGNLLSFHE